MRKFTFLNTAVTCSAKRNGTVQLNEAPQWAQPNLPHDTLLGYQDIHGTVPWVEASVAAQIVAHSV